MQRLLNEADKGESKKEVFICNGVEVEVHCCDFVHLARHVASGRPICTHTHHDEDNTLACGSDWPQPILN